MKKSSYCVQNNEQARERQFCDRPAGMKNVEFVNAVDTLSGIVITK